MVRGRNVINAQRREIERLRTKAKNLEDQLEEQGRELEEQVGKTAAAMKQEEAYRRQLEEERERGYPEPAEGSLLAALEHTLRTYGSSSSGELSRAIVNTLKSFGVYQEEAEPDLSEEDAKAVAAGERLLLDLGEAALDQPGSKTIGEAVGKVLKEYGLDKVEFKGAFQRGGVIPESAGRFLLSDDQVVTPADRKSAYFYGEPTEHGYRFTRVDGTTGGILDQFVSSKEQARRIKGVIDERNMLDEDLQKAHARIRELEGADQEEPSEQDEAAGRSLLSAIGFESATDEDAEEIGASLRRIIDRHLAGIKDRLREVKGKEEPRKLQVGDRVKLSPSFGGGEGEIVGDFYHSGWPVRRDSDGEIKQIAPVCLELIEPEPEEPKEAGELSFGADAGLDLTALSLMSREVAEEYAQAHRKMQGVEKTQVRYRDLDDRLCVVIVGTD